MKLIRGCFTFIGVITVLFFISLGFGYWLLSLSPPVKDQMTPVVLTPEAVQSLNQKLEVFTTEIREAIIARQEKEVNLVITEGEANSKLAVAIGEGKLPFTEVLVNFPKDFVLAYGTLKTPGLAIKIGAKASAEVVAGKPKLTVHDLYCGKLPLPEKIRNYSGKFLVNLIKVPCELPWQITKIQIADGQMIITGVAKKVW